MLGFFEGDIGKIFGINNVFQYRDDFEAGNIFFKLRTEEDRLSFNLLNDLSNLLGTDDIFISGGFNCLPTIFFDCQNVEALPKPRVKNNRIIEPTSEIRIKGGLVAESDRLIKIA